MSWRLLDRERVRLVTHALTRWRRPQTGKPSTSLVLTTYLRHRRYPPWTAWYVPYCQVNNDLWGRSHFNVDIDGHNYHILRTGAFPFVKFHCTRRPVADLQLEDGFYRALKVINVGFPCLLYGIAGLLWATHTEYVQTRDGDVTLYFWYRESRGAQH